MKVQKYKGPYYIVFGYLLLEPSIITRGVSHYGIAINIKKYLKAKEEELWKLKYFTMQKI